MSIHPRHWCVMGNLEQLTDNIWLPGYMAKLKHCISQHKELNDEEAENVMNEFQFYGNLPLGKNAECLVFPGIMFLNPKPIWQKEMVFDL